MLNCTEGAGGGSRIVQVALEGLQNLLQATENIPRGAPNNVADLIEDCGGLDMLEWLQSHQSDQVYQIAFNILQRYYQGE